MWIARQLALRAGPSPLGVQYPMWALYQWLDSAHKCPDYALPGISKKAAQGCKWSLR